MYNSLYVLVTDYLSNYILILFTAEETLDWTVRQTALTFSDVEVLRASSDRPLIATIVNDDVAEPRESFICNLLSGNADPVKAVPPTQVTVSITDDDGKTG